MKRCTETHWQGDILVSQGDIVADDDKKVIPQFFEDFPEPPEKKTATKK